MRSSVGRLVKLCKTQRVPRKPAPCGGLPTRRRLPACPTCKEHVHTVADLVLIHWKQDTSAQLSNGPHTFVRRTFAARTRTRIWAIWYSTAGPRMLSGITKLDSCPPPSSGRNVPVQPAFGGGPYDAIPIGLNVNDRRRYLSRRSAAQLDGLATGLQRAMAPSGKLTA